MLSHLPLNRVSFCKSSFDNLFAKLFFEIFFIAEDAGLNKIEEAPEFGKRVFDWSAGKNKLVGSSNVQRRLVNLSSAIFDFLSFV
jgi:hypothetical protein